MHAPWKQLAKTILAASVLSPLIALTPGCEKLESPTTQADRDVTAKLCESERTRLANPAQAQSALNAATAITQASPAIRIIAFSRQAQFELDSAIALTRNLDQSELAIADLLSSLKQLINQIQSGNDAAASYAKLDPKPVLDALALKVAEVQGSADKPAWFTHDDARIPTISAVKQEISRLEGEIAKCQQQANSLADQRAAALAEAEKTTQLALAGQGGKSLDLYKQSADLRKKAADLATEISRINAALLPLQADLAIANSQQTVLNETLEQFQQQAAQIKDQWTQIQKQGEAQSSISQSILADAASAKSPDTITAKLAGLAKLFDRSQKDRAVIIQNLENAASHYAQAVTAANALRAELGASPARPQRPV